MSQAARHNESKPALSEILHWPQALAEWAAHAQAGRAKYPDAEPGVPNWTLGGKPDDEYLDAAMRHLVAMKRGENYDPELGTTHAAAVIWNVSTLVQCNRNGRPTSDPGPDDQLSTDPVAETLPGTAVEYERKLGTLRVATPEPGSNTILFASGGKIVLTSEQTERAAEEGMLIYHLMDEDE